MPLVLVAIAWHGSCKRNKGSRKLKGAKTDMKGFSHMRRVGIFPILLVLFVVVLAACGTGYPQGGVPITNTIEANATMIPRQRMTAVAEDLTNIVQDLPEVATFLPDIEAQETMQWPDITMEDIYQQTETYLGETVKLDGYVNELMGEQTFLLGDSNVPSNNDMLVVLANTQQEVLNDDMARSLIGIVTTLDISQIENTFGFDLDEEQLAEYVGEPVVVAYHTWSEVGTPGDIALTDVATDTEALLGEQVHIQAEVSEVLDSSAFLVNQDDTLASENEVIVVLHSQIEEMPDLEQGAEVQLTGTVFSFQQEDIEVAANVELPSELYDEYEGRAAIVATNIVVP